MNSVITVPTAGPFGGRPVLAEGRLSARSLRTQQRARPGCHPVWRSIPQAGVLTIPARHTDRITSAPLVSYHFGLPSETGSGQVESGNVPSACQLLLRKEVIQPHLPVRLPCYDFVRIARPTFDGSLPKGLGHRLRVLPTFLT